MKALTAKRGKQHSEVVDDGRAQASQWTGGSVLTSRLVSVLVIGAVVCGPVALGVLLARGTPKPTVAAEQPKVQLTVVQQSAGAFAVGFVAAWLGATREDHAALDAFTGQQSASSLATTPYEYRNLTVSSLEVDEATGVVSVIVAGEVLDPQLDDAAAASWRLRYFQVAIATEGDTLTTLTLPAPVAGPASTTTSPTLEYRLPLAPSTKAGQTVTSFLAAYLTGQGTPEPYVSPSTTIDPIQPAPFLQLAPVTYQASGEATDAPADATELRVLATVSLQNAAGQPLTATYALSLRARDGRWEISGIDAAPQLSEQPSSVTTDSSSTSAPKGS